MKQVFKITVLGVVLPITLLVAGCEKEKSPAVAKKCYEGTSGLRGCFKVQRFDDNTSKCSTPADNSKPKAWFLRLESDTPVTSAGKGYDFTLKLLQKLYDQAGKEDPNGTTEVQISLPPQADFDSSRRKQLSCVFLPGATPDKNRVVEMRTVCLGKGTSCDVVDPQDDIVIKKPEESASN
ncbi:MAG: hypothetical protein MRJ68_08430 [Nitrospira sp.]|nr:hypothetical protein [Nitrospira sp.]